MTQEIVSYPVFGEASAGVGRSDYMANSIVFPDLSESQRESLSRPTTANVVTAGIMTLSPVEDKVDCLRAEWDIRSTNPADYIRLFIHDRAHDNSHCATFNTGGAPRGFHVFPGLVRGFYDIRYFRAGSGEHAIDVPVAVCCLGEQVPLVVTKKNAPDREVIVQVPVAVTEGPNDWLALFPEGEHGNRERHCKSQALLSSAKLDSDRTNYVVTMKMPKKAGQYQLRYFFTNSQSKWNSNAYSGTCPVDIPDENFLAASFDIRKCELDISWKVYSCEPGGYNWIAIYDDKENIVASDYVCYHTITSRSRDEGVVHLPRMENGVVQAKLPESLVAWSEKGVMPKEIRGWTIRFYEHRYLSKTPEIQVPFLPKPGR